MARQGFDLPEQPLQSRQVLLVDMFGPTANAPDGWLDLVIVNSRDILKHLSPFGPAGSVWVIVNNANWTSAPLMSPFTAFPSNWVRTVAVADFTRTGFRVPFIVVSPYAKAHFASHQIYDHTSITRFIEARFGLPALSGRDANATPPFEMFDFANPPFMTPPTIEAHTVVDPEVMAQCGQSLAPMGCEAMP